MRSTSTSPAVRETTTQGDHSGGAQASPSKRSYPSICMARSRTWTRFWPLPQSTTCSSWKTPARRMGRSTDRAMASGAGLARLARPRPSVSIPGRTSARAARAVRSRPTMRAWLVRSECSASTARRRRSYHDLEGYNGRLDAVQAAFLRIKLRHLDAWNAQRRAAAGRYDNLLRGVDAVVPPFEPDQSKAVFHLYVIRNGDRDALAAHLNSEGISTGLHYPLPVHLQKCYRNWGYAAGALPVTERTAAEILSLPMFPELGASAQQRVVSTLAEALASPSANGAEGVRSR